MLRGSDLRVPGVFFPYTNLKTCRIAFQHLIFGLLIYFPPFSIHDLTPLSSHSLHLHLQTLDVYNLVYKLFKNHTKKSVK